MRRAKVGSRCCKCVNWRKSEWRRMLDAYLGLDSDEETLGRWFSGSVWVLGTVESEGKGGENTCEMFGEVSQRAIPALGTC